MSKQIFTKEDLNAIPRRWEPPVIEAPPASTIVNSSHKASKPTKPTKSAPASTKPAPPPPASLTEFAASLAEWAATDIDAQMSSNKIIPRETLGTKLQQWELPRINNISSKSPTPLAKMAFAPFTPISLTPPTPSPKDHSPVPAEKEQHPVELKLPTAAEIATIAQDAYQEGFDQGQQDGIAQGFEQGQHDGLIKGQEQGHSEGFKRGYEEGLQQGQTSGYEQGYATGHEQGYAIGHEEGYAAGLQQGHAEGQQQGHAEGFTQGLQQGDAEGLQQGMEQGRHDGFAAGRQDGLTQGLEEGRRDGVAQGLEEGRREGVAQGLEEGRRDGFTQGVEEGRQEGTIKGHEQGYHDGLAKGDVEVQDQLKRLGQLLTQLEQPFAQLDREVEEQLVALSLATARQIVRRELLHGSGAIIPVIREALGSLPTAQRNLRIFLHPDDIPLVRAALTTKDGEHTSHLIEDPRITRGGCRVETDDSSIDATVEQRLDRVVAKLLGGVGGDDNPRKNGEERPH